MGLTIRLLLGQYQLEYGEASLLREDWARQPDKMPSLIIAGCRNNRIVGVEIFDPARYKVWLACCRVTHHVTGATGIVSSIEPTWLEVNGDDLVANEVPLSISITGLYRINLLKHGRPASRTKILLSSESATQEIVADDEGTITLVEDPRYLIIDAPAGISVIFEQVI